MIRKGLKTGASVLALSICSTAIAQAKTAPCATPLEIAAIKVSAIQQELMDSALGCGAGEVQQFNAFQTAFGTELRKSDTLMLQMFKRIMGNAKGDAQYNAFKTRAASDAELHRIHAQSDFCKAADLVFAAALAPVKPTLPDFAASTDIDEAIPVDACTVTVAVNTPAVSSGILPLPRPAQPDDPPSP